MLEHLFHNFLLKLSRFSPTNYNWLGSLSDKMTPNMFCTNNYLMYPLHIQGTEHTLSLCKWSYSFLAEQIKSDRLVGRSYLFY